jgi:general secretion pathway protein L
MPGQLMDGALPHPGEWIGRLGDGWRWWLAELRAMVPAPVRQAFSAGDDAILITAHEAELIVSRRTGADEYLIARVPRDEFAARTLRLAVPASARPGLLTDPVILQLPPEEALSRTLTLPAGARRNLDAILRHEIARHSPIGADAIYYDDRITGRDGAALTVELRIVRREVVDAFVQICRDAGIAIAAVGFAGDAAPADGGTFPVDATAARWLGLRPLLVPGLAALVLILALAFTGSLYLRGAFAAGDLAQRVDDAHGRAAVVEGLQRRLDAATRQAAFLAQQKRTPATVALLAAVARLLPDDAWLYQFERNGDEVRLHGFSASAASLIARFDSSSDFRDAEMRSPLMQGPTNATQRFDIAFKLRAAAP